MIAIYEVFDSGFNMGQIPATRKARLEWVKKAGGEIGLHGKWSSLNRSWSFDTLAGKEVHLFFQHKEIQPRLNIRY